MPLLAVGRDPRLTLGSSLGKPMANRIWALRAAKAKCQHWQYELEAAIASGDAEHEKRALQFIREYDQLIADTERRLDE